MGPTTLAGKKTMSKYTIVIHQRRFVVTLVGERGIQQKHTKIPWLGHQFIHQTNLLYGYSFEYFILCIWSVIHGPLNISGRLYRQQTFILLITISPMYNKLQRLTIALLVLSLLNSGSIVCCLLPSTHRFSCEQQLCMIHGSLNNVAITNFYHFELNA